VVGAERVVASTDCGFGTFAGMTNVAPSIVWAKLQSMAEGARRARARTGQP
jgi:5-methyltetrahydropteroyltriglutamate--homocysteine methyltransferase